MKQRVPIIMGALLLLLAAGLVLSGVIAQRKYDAEASSIVAGIRTLMPTETTAGGTDGSGTAAMPAVSYNGRDYVGILTVCGKDYPVATSWSQWPWSFRPAVYCGNIGNGSLTVMGNYSAFSFIERMDAGDSVVFTDILGHRYDLTVESIKRPQKSSLVNEDTVLTVFVKKPLSGYIALRCNY